MKKRFAFIGKSMLWSLLLYVVMMLAFNWDEVSNVVTGKNMITVVNNAQPEQQISGVNTPTVTPASISTHSGAVKSILAILKTISGISKE